MESQPARAWERRHLSQISIQKQALNAGDKKSGSPASVGFKNRSRRREEAELRLVAEIRLLTSAATAFWQILESILSHAGKSRFVSPEVAPIFKMFP